MKKMYMKNKSEIKRNKEQTDLVYNFLKKTRNNGVVKIYGSLSKEIDENTEENKENKNYEYNFYVLMELAEIDWEKEINNRKQAKNFYTEGEIYKIMRQLIKTFSELQKNYITHRDIKPQNILIVNNTYKIGDFGEAKITDGNSVIKQSIKGTELYMSPILFTALNKRQSIIIHNTFKSDVFSLGMCLFLAATLTFQSLYDIREIKDSKVIKKILEKYLIVKYSYNFVNILIKMLEVDENLRPDFIELENDFFYK
jgi:serine/threonine protein kinase